MGITAADRWLEQFAAVARGWSAERVTEQLEALAGATTTVRLVEVADVLRAELQSRQV